MEDNSKTSSSKTGGLFGIPDIRRILQLLFYVPVIMALGIVLYLIWRNLSIDDKRVLIYGIGLISFFVILGKYWEFSHKQKIKKMENEKFERDELNIEYAHLMEGTQGNLKKLLQNLIPEEGLDIMESINLQSPGKISEFYKYAREKNQYDTIKLNLIGLINSDISQGDIGIDSIEAIHSLFQQYTHTLKSMTDALIACMPKNIEEVIRMSHSDLYQRVIFEENSWVEHEALEMQKIFDLWIKNHLKEIALKRRELQKLISEQKNTLGELLEATSKMKEQSFIRVSV